MEDLKAQLGRSDEWTNQCEENDVVEDNRMVVPTIPSSVSGTPLEGVLLQDGWTLPTMCAKYREAVLAVEREEGKKQFEAILNEDVQVDAGCELSSLSRNEVLAELRMSKEETEKWKVEGRASQNQMQHYKSIAEATEAALKQMECNHDSFKIEVEKLKESLKARISELEYEVASATAGKEEARTSALTEIKNLKEERLVKNSQILAMEIKIKGLKEDLERENQRWRAAHANYERQVDLHTETIKELTETSLNVVLLQEEASELRKVVKTLKGDNEELNAKWETERAMLVESMDEAEKKYGEINEQNKILHDRVEALHIELARRDRYSAGISCGMNSADKLTDDGLQGVVTYLRRSNEIAEAKISVLKREKLDLQSQLERALKAAESAQASLNVVRANSRKLFTEEEMKSFELQVKEMSLLRGQNAQLGVENKQNFEECQKLREAAQKASIETKKLESSLREREIELEACREEIEMHKVEEADLEKWVLEVIDERQSAREEVEKLKVEVQASRDHMQQAENLKELLESDNLSLKARVSDLEYEVASATAGKEEARTFALAETTNLREELSIKNSQISAMEITISSLKEDLERGNQQWRAAQADYERQVVLQSVTIEEVTKTSQAWASLQAEAFELHRVVNAVKGDNEAKWEAERAMLVELKNEAEKKYREINEQEAKQEVERAMLMESKSEAEKKYREISEQNKILHYRVEALHLELAWRDRNSAGISYGMNSADKLSDDGLQSVVASLRQSKEIAEREISVLKHEKLRLQSQLESAVKAAENAQGSNLVS